VDIFRKKAALSSLLTPIVGDRGQAEAHPDHPRCIGRLTAMDAGVDPALAACRKHDLVHAELLRILTVEFGRLTERKGEIGRADIDRVDPGHIQDLVGYIRYHSPDDEIVDSAVVSVFDLLYAAYSQRLGPLAARLRKELKYPSEDIIWTVLHDILAEPRHAHLTAIPQVLLKNLLPNVDRLTPDQTAYVRRRASIDFVVYNRVTNRPLLAIEVDGFAFHENDPAQLKRDAIKNEIMHVHDMPLLRLPTTGSGEQQRIRDALTDAESRWARRSAQ